MKKFYKAAVALTTMLCLFSLSACGNQGEQPAAEEPAAQDSEQPEGESASSEGAIKVGMLAPLTGDVAQYGIAVSNGAKLYIDEFNAAGGINGKMIEAILYDEQGDPTQAITGYNSLVDQGVTAVIGDVTTGPTLAVVPEAYADNMPMITASATAAAVTYNEEEDLLYTNMFRSCFIDPFQGEIMAAFAYEELDAKTAAVLFNTGNDYSIGLKDAFLSKADEIGLEVTSIEGFADKAVDFQGQLTNISANTPDVLFIPEYYQTTALVAQQAKSVGLSTTLLGGDGWDTVTATVTDADSIEGSYYCSGYSSEDTTPAVQNFLSAYEAAYNEEPNMFAAQGYDAAMILIAGIAKAEEAGLEAGTDEYKEAVISAVKATDMECITGHVTYDEFNNPEKTAVIINIVGGEAKFWGKF